ncbi:MAG: SAM-dependent methyltransferase [Planctomycetes bacterium]|nr:SAM-dependent methyltransferase [Planctomycetota bacterium]
MRPDRPSDTAELVCAWRALEALLPEGERLVSDPFARAFVGPWRGSLLDLAERLPARARTALARQVDRALQGTMTFVLARHRAIDELIAATPQAMQVVLLGAGYDSRAVRLAPALRGRRVFEVDHPATAGRKAELAPLAYGDAPRAEVVPVSIDFAGESIEARLREAGLEVGALTLWVWEGVSMYLDEAAVRATLDLVRGLSAPGSLLAFDAWCPPAEGLRRLTRRDLPSLAFRLLYHEPLVWGPPPERLEPFLREHGLALLERVEAGPLVTRYGARRRPWLELSSMVFVVAEVDREVG